MLDFLQRTAQRLTLLRPLCLIIMFAALAVFLTELFSTVPGFKDETWLIPSGSGFLWSMVFWLFITTGRAIPSEKPDKGVVRKLKYRAARGYFYLLALLLIIGTGAAFFISVRFLRVTLL